MDYQSTRGGGAKVSAARAIVQGIAQDGGLFVPVSIPKVDEAFIESLMALDYRERALRVLEPWLPDFSTDALRSMIDGAYGRTFDVPDVAKTVNVKAGLSFLELWHGPTLAFKDMALQLMPRLLTASRDAVSEQRDILILVATSGDTGKAALEGFKDVPGTSIVVFYPQDGVSEAQRLQMVTQEGGNVHVVAVQGNFDDAQTGVKQIFGSAEMATRLDERGIVLSSANSINLGRLLPQIVYYFSAYADMRSSGAVAKGAPIDVCVPTGNFGNILAAAYAREMGLPIRKLICASNSNNVLADFIQTGVYDRNRTFHLTSSPSMDILISSNLERMVHHLLNGDGAQVGAMMKALSQCGRYALPEAAHEKLREFMVGGWASEDDVRDQIRRTFNDDGYLLDPHTAVALSVLERRQRESGEAVPALVVSTASPFKFGRSVLEAICGAVEADSDFDCCLQLAALSGQAVPQAIAELPQKPVLHHTCCTLADMPKEVLAQMNLT